LLSPRRVSLAIPAAQLRGALFDGAQALLGLADELIALAGRLLLAARAAQRVSHALLDVPFGLVGAPLGHLVLVAGEGAHRFLRLTQDTLARAFGLMLVHHARSLCPPSTVCHRAAGRQRQQGWGPSGYRVLGPKVSIH